MRDAALVGMGIFFGLTLHEAAHVGWRELQAWRRKRRDGPQWFRRQKPSDARPGPGPAQHPTPVQIKGQRAAGGAHRPRQQQARFSGRVRRTKAPK